MNLFYVEEEFIEEDRITIIGDDVNHIKNVLRMKIGESLVVCNQKGRNYEGTIESIGNNEIHVKITKCYSVETELQTKIYLFQGIPKKDKMDLIIQKAVELGVHEIIPVAMKRCVVKLEDKKKEKKKLERWNEIAKAAAKQSKRGKIPQVHEVISYKEALQIAKEIDTNLFLYENAKDMNYTKSIVKEACKGKSIGVFVGPEGGFDDKEIELIQELNCKPVTLGKRILRTETAGFTMLSILMYELEQQ